MLFQRLYNWIKYKTLPPSFLFKNRLFIERDSKHRRILSNFGLIFRNSKWSNYASYNIKTQFKSSYYRFLLFIIISVFILLLFINFNKYYIFFFFFNNISFLFWISIDTFDYYISFIVWFFTITLSLFLNLIYSYLFFNNFSEMKKSNNLFSNKFYNKLNISINVNLNDKFISKHDLNLLTYSWLINKNQSKSIIILEKLFESSNNWLNGNFFFSKLYKFLFYLNTNFHYSIKSLLNFKLNTLTNNKLIYNTDNTDLKFINNYFDLCLSYYFIKSNNLIFFNKINNSTNLIIKRFEWNLYNFSNELNKSPFLIKSKLGFFFFNDLNYFKLSSLLTNFEELWLLNDYLKNQLIVSKWNRWLYKYSILHRKILKSSHKITLSKKLLESGIIDSKLFDKNIWNNQYLKKYISNEQSTLLINNIYFTNLFQQSNNFINYNKQTLLSNFNNKNKFEILKFYENSYFWFLKRFYLLNNLNTNYIFSKNSKFNNNFFLNELTFKNKNEIVNKILYNYLLKSHFLIHNDLSCFNSIFNENNINLYLNNKTNNLFLFKDLYLNLNENELFYKDNLYSLSWITSNIIYQNKFIFFNYLSYLSPLFKNNTIFNEKIFINDDLNFYLFLDSFNIDNIYLNDLYYFNLFY